MCWSKPSSRRRAKPISRKLRASIFRVGWRLTRPATASAENSITTMATVTAAIITETCLTMPTAVITESSENTMSIKITGGNFTDSTGTGAAIAEGSMTNTSSHYGIEVMDNDAAGILSAKGTFERVELTNNTRDPKALGFIAAAMKARNEVEVKNSYVHDTQGNGLWCDNFCHDSDSHPNGFWVHDNLVVNNGRSGIRFEEVGSVFTAGEALIENNELHDNSLDADRGGISVRDAQNATIQNNRFGAATIGGVVYLPNSRDV